MTFLKEHLLHNHYSWADDNSLTLFNGTPSRRLFDPFNGLQVLFIINSFSVLSDGFSVEEGQKIENLIANKLPVESQSELSVFNWLKETL